MAGLGNDIFYSDDYWLGWDSAIQVACDVLSDKAESYRGQEQYRLVREIYERVIETLKKIADEPQAGVQITLRDPPLPAVERRI